MGGRREVSITHSHVTSSDLKKERLFLRGSVSTFLQLVVATDDKKQFQCLKTVLNNKTGPLIFSVIPSYSKKCFSVMKRL